MRIKITSFQFQLIKYFSQVEGEIAEGSGSVLS